MGPHRLGQSLTHQPGRGPTDHLRRHTKPRMVVQSGDHPQLSATHQIHPTHDVHLPQLHRPCPLPPPVISPTSSPLLRVNQPMTDQARSIDPRRNRNHPLPLQVIVNRPRTPTRMSPTHLPDPRLNLHHSRRLMRTRIRLRRPVHQPGQPLRGIPAQPHRTVCAQPHTDEPHPSPSPHPEPPTLPDTAAPQHPAPPTRSDPSSTRHEPHHRRRGGTRSRGPTSATHLLEPLSPRNRSRTPLARWTRDGGASQAI